MTSLLPIRESIQEREYGATRFENNMGMYCYFIHFMFNNFII